MEYQVEKLKKKRANLRESLIQLYHKSSSWEEFKVKADVEISNFSKNDMFACWMFWVKHEHPVLWKIFCFIPLVISIIALVAAASLSEVYKQNTAANVCGSIADVVLMLWLAIYVLYLLLYRQIFLRLEWLEKLSKMK